MSQEAPSGVVQRDVVRNLGKNAGGLRKGSHMLLVSSKWMAAWREAPEGVEEVDNSDLVDDAGQLRAGLLEGREYELVARPVWLKLLQWHGGGPEVARPVVEVGRSRRLQVEVYAMQVEVRERWGSRRAAFPVSHGDSVKQLAERVARAWYLPPHLTVLWLLEPRKGYTRLYEDRSAAESGVDAGCELVAESATPDGLLEPEGPEWVPPKVLAKSGASRSLMGARQRAFTPAVRDSDEPALQVGVTGLANLGNTCFMNSSLQCLFNCPPLVDYFLDDKRWRPEVNRKNPLGMGGKLAKSFAELIKRVWKENRRFLAPRDMKLQIGAFAPQFMGYRQHDSQEFVAFLLDGLHEDLNRVLKKQPTQPLDAYGMDDHEAARLAWELHQLRNRSEVVDLFHGQLRSQLTCPHCSKVSVTFDPFSFLSVPLPRATTRSIVVFFCPADGSGLKRVSVSVEFNATVADLARGACELLEGVEYEAERLHVVEVHNHAVQKAYPGALGVSGIGNTDVIYMYQLQGASKDVVHFLQRVRVRESGKLRLIGTPVLAGLTGPRSVEALREAAWRALEPHMQPKQGDFKLTVTSRNGRRCGVCREGCTGCEATEANVEGATTFSLEFPTDEWAFDSPVTRVEVPKVDETKSVLTLHDCVERFLEPEVLGEADSWYCPQCKDHVQAEKQIGMWALPRVLVVHLKRFAFLNARFREKINGLVDYPLEGLDLSQYVSANTEQPTPIYDLFAVSMHGGGLSGGHYTAYAKNKTDGNWYLLNDRACSLVTQKQSVVTAGAYMLFYIRRE